jgi:hypothetical protein
MTEKHEWICPHCYATGTAATLSNAETALALHIAMNHKDKL